VKEKLALYYSLTKPGVTYGNAITAVAGFLLAAQGRIDLGLFASLTVGITLVIASACVINNYLDQDIDSLMTRTKTRALVAGKLPGRNAVIFSAALGIVGVWLLYAFTNPLTAYVGVFGWIVYVIFYGALSKRLSIHGTLVGSVSGAAPIVAGYTAVTNTLDTGAFILFAILFFWQMPEFYSIAIYRRKEYAKAKVPVMTVVKGVPSTKVQIIIYTFAFVVSTFLLTGYGYAGYTYLAVMALLGGYWLWLAFDGQDTDDDDAWAKRMFKFSLVILLAFCLMISIDAWLP